MNKSQVLDGTRKFVRENMKGDGIVHDWWHIVRVVRTGKKIAQKEDADLFVVELGALLHDIADWKFTDGDTSVGPRIAKEWLESMNVDGQVIEGVVEIVEHISYRGGTNKHILKTLEGKIVQDADRMDAIGAVGIAKTFAYSGLNRRQIYDPDNPPKTYKNFDDFRSKMHDTTTVNHFYEKLLLLKDKMNTKTGREMAEHRHEYMEQFLKEFYAEWDGEC